MGMHREAETKAEVQRGRDRGRVAEGQRHRGIGKGVEERGRYTVVESESERQMQQ